MTFHPAIDIIVPVWNRPVETRNCLVTLLHHTENFRLILVDNGSDPETEKMLQEFADGLDDRALLLRNDVNQGLVRALNQGLEKGAADYLVILKNTSLVEPEWLEPLLDFQRQRPEAGLIVPTLLEMGQKVPKKIHGDSLEIAHGSFAAMLIKKEVHQAIGGFDEEMDGGSWCLKDYSRRALKAGFLTLRVSQVTVRYVEDILLGSEARRQENLQKTLATFRARWGVPASYCLVLQKGEDPEVIKKRFQLLLQGARHDLLFHIIIDHHVHKKLQTLAISSLHDNIRLYILPFLHTASTVRKQVAGILSADPAATVVADGSSFAGAERQITFAQLEEKIKELR